MTARLIGAFPTSVIDSICDRVVDRDGEVVDLVAQAVRQVAPLASPGDQDRLAEASVARLTGLGELDAHVRDPSVDEVLVNAGRDIWIDRAGVLTEVGVLSSQPLENIIERILAPIGRRLDLTSPIVDARLADGSRVCAVMAPVGVDGTSLSIRRFAREVRAIADFTTAVGETLIHEIMRSRCNVVVSGATSSGKTSLLASMIACVPRNERIVLLEDTAELPIDAHHVVRLEARPATPDGPPPIGVVDLVRTALRLRPDRLVVGEIRGDEVLGMVQAMNTGHDGSFSTCHANGPLDALLRLESLVLQASPSWPLSAIRQQIARSIDVIVHVARSHGDGGRRITSICEIVERHGPLDQPELRTLARLDDDGILNVAGDLSRRRR